MIMWRVVLKRENEQNIFKYVEELRNLAIIMASFQNYREQSSVLITTPHIRCQQVSCK